MFYPDATDPSEPKYWSALYWDTKSHKGDWMTKELPPKDFEKACQMAGYLTFS